MRLNPKDPLIVMPSRTLGGGHHHRTPSTVTPTREPPLAGLSSEARAEPALYEPHYCAQLPPVSQFHLDSLLAVSNLSRLRGIHEELPMKKIALGVLGVGILGLVAAASMQDDKTHVERSISIAATPAT